MSSCKAAGFIHSAVEPLAHSLQLNMLTLEQTGHGNILKFAVNQRVEPY